MFGRIFGRKPKGGVRSLRAAAALAERRGTEDGKRDGIAYVEGYLASKATMPVTEALQVVIQLGKGVVPTDLGASAVHESESATWAQEVLARAGLNRVASSPDFDDARRRLHAYYEQFYRFHAANTLYSVAVGTYPDSDLKDGRYPALAAAGVVPAPWADIR